MIKFYDNGGKTVDRYTMAVHQAEGWDLYGFSNSPNVPNGFNQFCGTVKTLSRRMGKAVMFDDVPENVQRAMMERITPTPF